MPPIATIEKLNELATSELARICKESSHTGLKPTSHKYAEVIAAKELLDRGTQQQS